MTLRLGTRSSKLALWQTSHIAERLRAVHPGLSVVVVRISTHGDETPDQPLPEIGGKGLFTERIEQALRAGQIDAAVHSLKDLPVEDSPETMIAAVLGREDARDVVISRTGQPLNALPPGAVIGTSSTRREAQIRSAYPHLALRPIRGNVETRIAKVEEGQCDATVLAAAGVVRLGLSGKISEWLDAETFLPAPGQGALAVQCRSGDAAVLALLSPLDDAPLRRSTEAEREFLRALGGGCAAPVAAFAAGVAAATANRISLRGRVISPDGTNCIDVHGEGDDPHALGRGLADEALEAGAGAILSSARSRTGHPLPLAGRRIVVTRPRAQAAGILGLLAEQGAVGIPFPLIRIEPAGDARRKQEALNRLSDYDWVLFTSVNSIQNFISSAGGEPARAPLTTKIAAVGPVTAEALRSRGLAPTLVAEEQSGDSLAKGVIEGAGISLSGARILFPCAEDSDPAAAEALRRAGAVVDELPVYRTVAQDPAEEDMARVLKGADAFVFMSGSAVRACSSLVGRFPKLVSVLQKAAIACIGESTAEAARAEGLRVDVIPDQHTSAALVAAVARHFSARAGKVEAWQNA